MLCFNIKNLPKNTYYIVIKNKEAVNKFLDEYEASQQSANGRYINHMNRLDEV